jgi:hypothetical protein
LTLEAMVAVVGTWSKEAAVAATVAAMAAVAATMAAMAAVAAMAAMAAVAVVMSMAESYFLHVQTRISPDQRALTRCTF